MSLLASIPRVRAVPGDKSVGTHRLSVSGDLQLLAALASVASLWTCQCGVWGVHMGAGGLVAVVQLGLR